MASPIGFFAPLPLALMIPFMAAQSFAMGEAFGKGFQYGKRKVSSMTNEEFNTKTGASLYAETTVDINNMIPSMKNQMSNFALLQSDIIKEMIGYLRQLPSDVVSGLLGGGGSAGSVGENAAGSPYLPTQTQTELNLAILGELKEIRSGGRTPPVFNEPAIEDLKKQLEDLMKVPSSSPGLKTQEELKLQELLNQVIKVTTGASGEKKFETAFDPNNPEHTKRPDSVVPENPKQPLDQRLRAPDQIVTNYKKLKEEYNALSILKPNSPYRNYAWQNIRKHIQLYKNWVTNQTKIRELEKKYIL